MTKKSVGVKKKDEVMTKKPVEVEKWWSGDWESGWG